jgi:transposase-like protein
MQGRVARQQVLERKSMRGKQYPQAFRLAAVRQVLRGRPCQDVASELGVTTTKLQQWLRRHVTESLQRQAVLSGVGTMD